MLTLDVPQAARADLDFNAGFSANVMAPLQQATTTDYDRAVHAFEAEHGHGPQTWEDVRDIMESLPAYRANDAWGKQIVRRVWRTMSAIEAANHASILAQLEAVPDQGLGRLVLDPHLSPPAFFESADFHLVPGSYHHGYVYPFMNDLPQSGTVTRRSWTEVERQFDTMIPKGDYQTIVDFGCGLGRSSIALKRLYPAATVYGLDFSEPELRYAHFESENQGLAIEYRQEDAAHTSFPDASVDLVVAYIFHHEFPPEEMRRVMAEAARILKPGGLFVNGDITPLRELLPKTIFMTLVRQEWSGSEPYWMQAATMDLPQDLRGLGFADVTEIAPPDHPNGLHYPWYTLARKA